jgi:uncharacterized membrane protein YgaE (UPF0421/DUF939 family)
MLKFINLKFINLEPLTHSLKTVIAMLIGFLIAILIQYPADQWILITIVVVMCAQMYVGSVVLKAYLRFLGTLIGCLFATLAIILFGDTDLTIFCTIGISSFFFSYLAANYEKLSYAATLGAITTIIIMINPHPTILLAGQRFLEISIGIFIAAMVSQFVLPIHAGKHLRRAQADTLEQLKEYYSVVMMRRNSDVNYHDLDENIVKSLLKQRQLAKESAREPLGKDFNPKYFMQTLYCEREILRSITFMHIALLDLKDAQFHVDELPSLNLFNESILATFDSLIKSIVGDKTKESISMPSLDVVKLDLQKNLDRTSSREELIYIDGFLFSALLLTKSLARLNKIYG